MVMAHAAAAAAPPLRPHRPAVHRAFVSAPPAFSQQKAHGSGALTCSLQPTLSQAPSSRTASDHRTALLAWLPSRSNLRPRRLQHPSWPWSPDHSFHCAKVAQVRRLHAGAPATRQRRTCAAAKKGVQWPLWQAAGRAGGLRSARAAARRLADHVQCVCEARVGLPAHVLSCASSCAYAVKGQFLLSRSASALCSTPVCLTLTLWTF